MAFKTLTVVDYDKETFEYTTKIADNEIAFIISELDKIVYVWTGHRASMIKKYKAGTLATKIKSLFHFYGYKTQTVKQGEETGELQEEVEKLLRGEGTPAEKETGLSKEEAEAKETPAVDVEQMKSDYEAKIKALEAEMDKLQANYDALKSSIDDVTSDFQNKIKTLELEKEKVQGEIDAARNEANASKENAEARVGDLRSELERAHSEGDALKTELTALRQDLEARNKALESENNELKRDMAEKIQKIKEEATEKVKVNFYNMKALPSAPAGAVWFESIVQVITGDKASFAEIPKEVPMPIKKVKPAEKAQPAPRKVTAAKEKPPEGSTPVLVELPEEVKQEELAIVQPEEIEGNTEEKAQEPEVELDFMSVDEIKAKKKSENPEFDVLKLESDEE